MKTVTGFHKIFPNSKTIIGMISLPPLLGLPGFTGMDALIERALGDLDTLQQGGVDGVCVENDYDRPHQITVGPENVASFTRVAHEVALHATVPVGVQVLLNDWRASLAIAAVTGAQFARLDFFVDRVRIDAGIIEPQAEAVLAYRKQIRAENVALFTDLQVKYSELLEPGKSLRTSASQAIANGADALVITGKITGDSPSLIDLHETRDAVGDFPILVGSGAAPENAGDLFRYADGAIVGTALKSGMAAQDRIVLERVQSLISAARAIRG